MVKLQPVTPGELLREEFLTPMRLSQYRLAKEIGVPAQRISEIVAGKRRITADTDLRLCRFLGLSNGYWLRAQAAYDTEVAEEVLAKDLMKIKPWRELQSEISQSVKYGRVIEYLGPAETGLLPADFRSQSGPKYGSAPKTKILTP